MSEIGFWSVTLLIGLGSLAFRVGFHALSTRARPTPLVRRALETLPPAILIALLAPMVFRLEQAGPEGGAVDWPTLVGVTVALGVGVAARNFIWALLGGLAAGAAALLALGVA